MLRFAFRPRHPVECVAFTADGREVITAQPHTGIAFRDRLTGEARLTIHLLRAAVISHLAVHATDGWVGVRSSLGSQFVDVRSGKSVPATSTWSTAFGTTAGSQSLAVWGNNPTPVYTTYELPTPDLDNDLVSRHQANTISTTGQMVAASPDTAFALCLRPQTRPLLADIPTGTVVAELSCPIRVRHHPGRSVIVFSPDGSKLALGNGEVLAVFDLSAVPREPDGGKRKVLNPLFTLERPDPTEHGTHADKLAETWLPPVAFDHAGRTMFTLGLRNRVQRIDLSTGGLMGEWGWRGEPIRSLAVAPDGLTAAAGCRRGELLVWDLE
jgi:hypothetical protein